VPDFLSEGRSGIAQLALHSEKAVIPVGCNGSETVYPGSSPFARSGMITYRIGKPMTVHNHFKEFRIKEKFKLFSKESQQKFAARLDNSIPTLRKMENGDPGVSIGLWCDALYLMD
jgi:hypothetical protein